jgi:adenylate cyclase
MPADFRNLRLSLYEKQQLVLSTAFSNRVEVGRQQAADEEPFRLYRLTDRQRLVVAPLTETAVPRRHALLEPLDADSVRVTNISHSVELGIGGSDPVPPNTDRVVGLPLLLVMGSRAVRLERILADEEPLNSLRTPTLAPGRAPVASTTMGLPLQQEPDSESLFQWLQLVSAVLQRATSSDDFFQHAAHGIVDLIGLSCGAVMLRHDGRWQVASFASANPEFNIEGAWQASTRILTKVLEDKRTLWQGSVAPTQAGASLSGVHAVIAAPILSKTGEVMGALYGDRRSDMHAEARITRLEAMLVEALAFGVSAGLARLEEEKAAVAAQVKFEQFFTPQLARQLAVEPDLLRGRDAEVTLLFCDIRGFSRISERLSPAETLSWIGDVMEVLSDYVAAHAGVLVDYIGDELIAMWGAPQEQPEQATLACRAALDMLSGLRKINERWQKKLGEPVRVGIGINTGVAHVGNTGSQRKFKYGALGTVVNVASRVQGASKYLKTDLLITSATRNKLGNEFATRRLCSVNVVNIEQTLDLFEIRGLAGKPASPAMSRYEAALEAFEKEDFRQAANMLAAILAEWPDDGPSLLLLSRAVDNLLHPKETFSPSWELPGK